MTAFLDRIRYWLGKREPVSEAAQRLYAAEQSGALDGALEFIEECPAFTFEGMVQCMAKTEGLDYMRDFGPNVPVEDLGAEPIGWEKAP